MVTKKKTETETATEVETETTAEKPKRASRSSKSTSKSASAKTNVKTSATKEEPKNDEEASTGKRPARTKRTRKSEEAVQAEETQSQEASSENAVAQGAEEGEEAKSTPSRRPRRESVKIEKSEAIESASKKEEAADQATAKAQIGGHHNSRHNANNRHQRRQQRNREVEPSITREELEALKIAELRTRALELNLDATGMKKPELVEAVYEAAVRAEGFLEVEGILDILSDGYGFLRTSGYLPSETDCYVAGSLIKRNGLRKGDHVKGTTRPARENEKFAAIQKIELVNGISVEELSTRPRFADLTPIYPSERLEMEHGKNTYTARVIDLVAPIGKGQRGLIVSPPKAGKTTILKDIAASISANNPEVHLMCLLVDERPEEVTDMQRSINGEVIHSTFDMPAENHIAVAEMVIERAKRLVEQGKDVVILLDSITRLARAYNLAQPASGRVLSGGVDSTALYPPKRFLGAARNIENGGSLTILASALIETGSKMDEVIFEEFKGTGNMELRLDRQLADRRIFPAIDPIASGTRKEELLLDAQMMPIIWAVRRILANMNNTERAMDMLIKSVKQTDDNEEFLLRMARKAQHGKTESLEL